MDVDSRDAYGFAVRPQHLQRYREYAKIYKEEEGERSERWKKFLEMCVATQIQSKESSAEVTVFESKEESANGTRENHVELDGSEESSSKDVAADTSESPKKEISVRKHEMWAEIRPSLSAIDHLMSFRVKKKTTSSNSEHGVARRSGSRKHLDSIQEGSTRKEEGSDEELQETERSDEAQEQPLNNSESDDASPSTTSQEPFFPWKEELESLVRGGVPMALRGEVWQSFVGVRTRRVEGYYQNLLSSEANASNNKETKGSVSNDHENLPKKPAKWKTQIEKDLPRTFPGHPALDEDGRDALRRLLTAYALHNPYVGYCQAMNFFAGLLLLLMPEENAFWTLIGIIDDYFEGYYSEEMIECQVDQLVFEELVRERFPKLVNHLDYLGVQVAWVTGAWFLSIFMNMLPWESVLRVWDVLLFDGNRLMLFRTALALLELYGPALVTTKDAGDAITLLQSLAGSTFDSSQLVLIASMGYQAVTETRLQDLRNKHRPDVLVTMEERSRGLASKDSKGLASKLYSFKHDPASALPDSNSNGGRSDMHTNGDVHPLESGVTNFDGFFNGQIDAEVDSVPDLQEQVTWLKVELCRLLEEKRSAILRAEELETALMEMVKQDNRRILTAKVEQLKLEVSELRQSLSDKQEQERAMLEVLMRVEQEQKVTEDARISAEQEAAAQKYAAHVLQEKYEESLILYAQMEKRAVMAETMLEATIQYQSGQHKAQQSVPPSPSPSPSTPRQESSQNASSQDTPKRRVGLLARPFVLGWLDKSKNKAGSSEDSSAGRNSNGWEEIPTPGKDIPGVQTPGEDLPGKDISGVQTPGKDLPGVQTPGKDLPGVETPRKDINDEQMVDK